MKGGIEEEPGQGPCLTEAVPVVSTESTILVSAAPVESASPPPPPQSHREAAPEKVTIDLAYFFFKSQSHQVRE